MVKEKLLYYPSTTRETSRYNGRITDNLTTGKLYTDLELTPLDSSTDRCMVCGSLEFNVDVMAILAESGFTEGSSSEPSSFVIEKAFVD